MRWYKDLNKAIQQDDLQQVIDLVHPTVWEQMVNNFSIFNSQRDPKLNTKHKQPALTTAVQSKQPNAQAITHLLLSNGANPDNIYSLAYTQQPSNRTPLLDSIQTYINKPNKRTREIAELMIDYAQHYQPSINQAINNGRTIAHETLMLAQNQDQEQPLTHIIDCLYKHGCHFDITDNQGKLPQDYGDLDTIQAHVSNQNNQNKYNYA